MSFFCSRVRVFSSVLQVVRFQMAHGGFYARSYFLNLQRFY